MIADNTSPHFRFWIGKRQANLPPQSFAQTLMESFIPGTPALMFPLGLQWYAPTILPLEKPIGMADELALLLYANQKVYQQAQTTIVGKIYNLAHSGLFDFSAKASTTLTHDGWGHENTQSKRMILGCGDWPAGWAVTQMGPEHLALSALQFSATHNMATLQNVVHHRLKHALESVCQADSMDSSIPTCVPTRLFCVWQTNTSDHSPSGPNLYLWCLSALGHHWATDALHRVLRQALPAALTPDPLSAPIWLWQAPHFESAEITTTAYADSQADALTGRAWGRGWVYRG